MPLTSRDAIQEDLVSKDVEPRQMRDSTLELNKLAIEQIVGVAFADTVRVQGCRKHLISLVLPRIC